MLYSILRFGRIKVERMNKYQVMINLLLCKEEQMQRPGGMIILTCSWSKRKANVAKIGEIDRREYHGDQTG